MGSVNIGDYVRENGTWWVSGSMFGKITVYAGAWNSAGLFWHQVGHQVTLFGVIQRISGNLAESGSLALDGIPPVRSIARHLLRGYGTATRFVDITEAGRLEWTQIGGSASDRIILDGATYLTDLER